eukprot:jgi/Picre1/34980/NNA_002445.t1
MASSKRFSELGLTEETLNVIENVLGFERATPVQEATIPLFSGNKDVSVDACTGSGKTLAFVVPIIEKLRRLARPLKKHQVGAVILSPTRELARQIMEVASCFIKTLDWASVSLLVGGRDPQEDVAMLQNDGCTLLIGTPGRIDDVFERCRFIDLKSLEVLVLDEADRLLDMGFERQIDSIMRKIPRQRRTGLFSATQTDAVKALARAGLRNPIRVAVAVEYKSSKSEAAKGQVTPGSLQVYYRITDQRQKVCDLFHFLAAHSSEKVIVYFLTCACVDYFHLAIRAMLRASGKTNPPKLMLHTLHGRMKQAAREASLNAFSKADSGILIATDVAARGLDIPDVHWVLQYDAPQDPSSFVHRCGRTARMGRSGNAVIFLTPQEESYVKFLELRKVPMKEDDTPWEEERIDKDEILHVLRRESETDRLMMDFGMRAFVSYLRAYKEHVCKYIFQFGDLQMGWLASSFALLRLPKMKEVKKAARLLKAGELEGFSESSVDPATIPFKDKMREKQRQSALRKVAQEQEEANSMQEKPQKKRKKEAKPQQPSVRLTAAKRRTLESRQELADLDEDYALWKKLKKGKISLAEYDAATEMDEILDSGSHLLDAALKKKAKKKARKKR